MNEASKTRSIMGPLERGVLQGSGIDIGCGPDPILPGVRRFDMEDGDANVITAQVKEEFDFVFSSHCLEHMHEPRKALLEWWQLVKPGGHIYFLVPDEDLYEQGVFPSRFNPDHKATFTLSKARSWSPKSINVLELAESLPDGRVVSVVLHDHGYDRSWLRHGPEHIPGGFLKFCFRVNDGVRRRTGVSLPGLGWLERKLRVIDQTGNPVTLAQIQCIVQKLKQAS